MSQLPKRARFPLEPSPAGEAKKYHKMALYNSAQVFTDWDCSFIEALALRIERLLSKWASRARTLANRDRVSGEILPQFLVRGRKRLA